MTLGKYIKEFKCYSSQRIVEYSNSVSRVWTNPLYKLCCNIHNWHLVQ